MSDILIKGMEMPPDCTTCPFCVVFPKKQLGMCVAFGDGSNREKLNGRMENCPLHELPPHGDLIQRTDVLAVVDEAYEYGDVIKRKDFDENNIPAIVPAEKGETR